MEDLNLATLPKYLSDEHEAWALLERLRWADGVPVCPHCGTKDEGHYFLASRSGERRTKKGNVTYRRLWKCRQKECRKQFSVLVGTVFESSKIPASKWLLAMWLMSAGKNGVSALELQRHLDVAYQTAWFLAHRLREAMTREPLAALMSGTVVADETFIGGKAKNMHRNDPRRFKQKQGGGGKPPVLALIDADSTEVRTKVITDVQGPTLAKALREQVDVEASVLHTDESRAYMAIGREFADHKTVNHSNHEYVRDGTSTNLAESFFAQFKRSLDGTHHSVSRHHLNRYANEFEFRWNTRDMTDSQRMSAIVNGSIGKRLTYRPITEG
jgi:transposase-like protein